VEAAACLHILSLTLGDLGEYDAALKASEEALALSRLAGDGQYGQWAYRVAWKPGEVRTAIDKSTRSEWGLRVKRRSDRSDGGIETEFAAKTRFLDSSPQCCASVLPRAQLSYTTLPPMIVIAIGACMSFGVG
jgi:hypothetical protein